MTSIGTGLVFLGAALGVASVALYGAAGYSTVVIALWLAALALVAAALAGRGGPIGLPSGRDVAAPLVLLLGFAPLYLLRLDTVPVQVNSDEVAIMTFAKQSAGAHHVDLFGLSTYFGHPIALFVLWGKLGNLLGGIDLGHMRLLHALTGLLTIALSYAFFRQLLTLPWALLASALLGVNHAFLMISRMAMRENTVVLVEVVALALLLVGLRKDNPLATFAGGVTAALGFYVHFPGRMIFPLWLAFLAVIALAWRDELGLGRIGRLGAIASGGFALVAAPYVIAYAKAPGYLTAHQREALLIYPQGRKLQEQWVGAHSIAQGIERNVVNGLTAFNTDRVDHAYIYPNFGHGIVDPLTGALLWLGALVVLVAAIRHRGNPLALFPLVGFLVLWLAFALLVGQAPDYPRMLVILPFVAYLVTVALRFLAAQAERVHVAAPAALAVAALLAIGSWNGVIGWDFVHAGRFYGDDIGGTGRYVQRHDAPVNERFYVAADQGQWNYYVWGTPSIWQERIRIFARSDAQVGGVIAPRQLDRFSASPPFVVFMQSGLWSQARGFRERYPQARTDEITPDGRLVAVRVT